jgi:mannose-1-phosphate guanylyltransferase/phosphomannomutase
LAFHRQRKSAATIALKKVDLKFDYGVTLTTARGKITKFVEKPQWGDVFSNQVNTGIYVFEPRILRQIPEGQVSDFGHDIWPKLLLRGEPIYGYLTDRYWCDVGNLTEYRRAQREILDGKTRFRPPGREVRRGIWVEEGARIADGVKLEAPCLIGRDSRLDKGCVIGAYTVVGRRARIGSGSRLQNCILWNDVQVGRHVRLENCVIGHQARVTESISMYEGSVIQAT